MPVESQMKELGLAAERRWYWAGEGFENPGPYYWDGRRNVNAADSIRTMRSMLRAQLRKVDFHGQILWESPDGEGGQFSNADVALDCWIDRTLVKDPL